MKRFTKVIGILLCLAMVLSFVPVISVGAVTTDNAKTVSLTPVTGLVVPEFGYYTNGTTGAITPYYQSGREPAYLIDGNSSTQARSEQYAYDDVTSGAKTPVILFTLSEATVLGGIKIEGYQYKRYNMENFEVQVSTTEGTDTWVTAATVTDAFRDGTFGDDAAPLMVEFDQSYTAYKLRIVVKKITNMVEGLDPNDGDYEELAAGGYIRIKEITLYGIENTGNDSEDDGDDEVTYPETAKLNGIDIENFVIVYSNDELDYNWRAAEHIQNAIKTKTGRTISIVEDDTPAAAYEIIVGETNRSLSATISAPANQQMKFTITSDGTSVAMEADYFIIAGAAYYFTETFIGKTNFDNTVPAAKQELAPITKQAKNYIFLIGDGMGVMQTKFFDKFGPSPTTGTYGYGDGEDIFYGYYLPYQGWSKTANVFGTITDSAAGGTALATGYKTINGYVGKDKNLKDIKNLSELAWDMGKAVGIMSTEGSDGATPASFSAHAGGRYDDEIITDQDAMEEQGYVFVERYRSSADAYNAVFKSFTAEEFGRWDTKVKAGMSKLTADPDGFFLMYEEAYIDKNCHNDDQQNAYRTIYRFNQHIAYFMEFAMYNPETFVLITADHETSGLTEDFVATQFNLPPSTGCDHSLQNVPVFVYGEGGEIFDGVTAENASIGRTFAHIMTNGNADDFGNPLYPIIGEEPGEDVTAPDGDVPEAPTTPVVQGTILKIVSPTRLTTKFGVYPSRDPNGAFSDGNDGYCVTDGWYIRSGYSEHNKADGLTALLIDLDTATTLGGLEITGHTSAGNDPTNFDIQVYTDGTWVTVKSVTSNPFAEGPRTVKYTFDPVSTSKVRLLIHDYEGTGACHIGEVTLFESTTGNVSTTVSLLGQGGVMVDGDKSTTYTGTGELFNLTVDGQPTAVSGFGLYHARANNTAYPSSVTVAIQRTHNGGFETIGVFETGWSNTYPLDSVFVDFGQTYMAYAISITFNTRSAVTELELYQNVHEEAPEEPPVGPTDPTEPSEPATQPSEPATQPSEPATQPSEPATQPSEPATQPSEPDTDEPGGDEPLPEDPDLSELAATIEIIDGLNPDDYTAESYAALMEALEAADAILGTDGYTQEMVDEANELLAGALANLVLADGGETDDNPPADTGDIILSVLAGMMSLAAAGGAVVISKKKD